MEIDNITMKYMESTLNFYELVSIMKGVHPIEIRDSIKRLYESCSINENQYMKIFSSMDITPNEIITDDINDLPVPHQMDYDWRFSKSGLLSFINRITCIISSENVKSIAFIGSPSLFKYYSDNTALDIQFYLIDFNASKHMESSYLRSNFKVLNCNVNYEMIDDYYKDIVVDMVVMDPPWYIRYYKRIFEVCSYICNVGATVLGVFPPKYTRHTIISEITELSQFIDTLGFDTLCFHEHSITYSTPPFESNVLKVNGINNYPQNWRVGDLFEVKRMRNTILEQEDNYLEIEAKKWQEVSIGVIRVKLLQHTVNKDKIFSIKVKHLYPKDIYPSVSSRFVGSEKINVWTSGNRVYNCNNIPLLKLIIADYKNQNLIQTLESEYSTEINSKDRKDIMRAQKLVGKIVEREDKEYGYWDSHYVDNHEDITNTIKAQILNGVNDNWHKIICTIDDRQIHLAIMVEPYLSLLLSGHKTIESRITENLTAPHRKVCKGDIIIIKKSGGPICGVFEAGDVHFFAIDDNFTIWDLRRTYNNRLLIENDFWQKKKNANYATLIEVKNALRLVPIKCNVPNRKSWVFLLNQKERLEQMSLYSGNNNIFPTIICISGKIASGKTTLSSLLAEKLKCNRFSTSDYLRSKAATKGYTVIDRTLLQMIGEDCINEGWENFARAFLSFTNDSSDESIIIDGVRHVEFYNSLKKLTGKNCSLIFLDAREDVLLERLQHRGDGEINYTHVAEGNLSRLKEAANYIFDANDKNAEFISDEILGFLGV